MLAPLKGTRVNLIAFHSEPLNMTLLTEIEEATPDRRHLSDAAFQMFREKIRRIARHYQNLFDRLEQEIAEGTIVRREK